jgi:phosphoesterase RecJ-like protein
MKPSDARKRDKVLDEILRAVRRGKTFFLAGHEKPDGDTIGSELAFASLLRRLGKRVDIYNAEPVPDSLRFLPGADRAKASRRVEKDYDVAVVFECSGPDRMGNILDLKRHAKTVINIDHHAHHSYFGDINLINPRASSNSEQLFYLWRRARMPITRDEAMALYVGLVTDTGRFQQENTNPDSHEVAGGLVAVGIPVAEISRRLYYTRTPSALGLLGRALGTLKLLEDGRISVLTLTQPDFAETRATPDETEDVINHGLMPETVLVALFARETEAAGRVKVSLRGKGKVDLCRIAVKFGGGGHKNASGCTVSGSLEQAVDTVLREVRPSLP